MKNNKLHTPEGVRDLLPQDCSIKLDIERNIIWVFNTYGYYNIETPTFEYYEVFSDEDGSISPNQMYKFFDRDGSILALRADMTPPIARVVATEYNEKDLPLRLCYLANAFRYNENYQGKLREFSQAGVELIGVNSNDADAEVIAIAVNSLLASGLRDFRIDIGQVDFLNGLIEEAGFKKEIASSVQDMISKKDYIALEEILDETKISKDIKTIFIGLPKLVGSIDVLESTKKVITNSKALNAIEKLENLYNIFKAYRIEKYISFDLGMITHINYYTGIIFRGYTYGTGFSIIDGGRYDKLIENFGMDKPAVGFAVRINEVLNALERQNITVSKNIVDFLLVYSESCMKSALSLAYKLRENNYSVENSLIGYELDKNLDYARAKNISKVIFFEDANRYEVIDLKLDKKEVREYDEISDICFS